MKRTGFTLKLSALFLALVMIVTLFPGLALADETAANEDAAAGYVQAEQDADVQAETDADLVDDLDFAGLFEDTQPGAEFGLGSLSDLEIGEDDDYDIVIEDIEYTTDEDTGESITIELDDDEAVSDEEADVVLDEPDSDEEEAVLEDAESVLEEETAAEKESAKKAEEELLDDAAEEDTEAADVMIFSEIAALTKKMDAEGVAYDGFMVTLTDDAINQAEGEQKTQMLEYTDNTCVAESAYALANDYDYSDIVRIEPNYMSRITGFTSSLSDEEKAQLMEDMVDEGSSADSVTTPNDPLFQWGYQSNLNQMNIRYAWKKGISGSPWKGSKKVVVAVIDTGIYPYHEDLRSSHILSGKSFVNYSTYDDQGHGTACASVIMATRNNNTGMTGIAPNVYVLPIKALDSTGWGTEDQIVDAINYATSRGVDVISMSLSGYGYTSAKKAACDKAIKKGIIVVAAAGNSANPYTGYYDSSWQYDTTYPAGFSSVIGVASVDDYNYHSYFSQVNSDSVYCCAPGEEITVCKTSYDGYTWMDGTSFSCPSVAAAAALAKSVNRNINSKRFKALLRATCLDLGASGKDSYYGYGLINMKKMTNKLLPVKKITLNKKKTSVAAGKLKTLKATVTPKTAADKRVRWKSSNSRIVRVSSKGKIRGLHAGKAKVTATCVSNKKLKATCTVRVLFKDVAKSSKYYYKPVYWAVDKKITKGVTSTRFKPGAGCTRKQFVIFLWRMAGRPKAKGTTRFRDINNYYGKSTDTYKATLWAYKKGVIKGVTRTKFAPDQKITRKQAILMLYRYKGKPKVTGTLKFRDMRRYKKSGDTYKSVLWGTKKGIIGGYSDNTFRPKRTCKRAHVVTFLYRYKH